MDPANGQRRGERGTPNWLYQLERRGWRRVLALWGFAAVPFFGAFEEEGLDPVVPETYELAMERTAATGEKR